MELQWFGFDLKSLDTLTGLKGAYDIVWEVKESRRDWLCVISSEDIDFCY